LVPSTYARWIDRWENHLATRDGNRVVRPFEWGTDWLDLPETADPEARIAEYSAQAVKDSQTFFAGQTPVDFRLAGSHLTFTSPLQTRFPENNTVHGEFFPCRRARGRAVLVMPQWNAGEGGHVGLCRLLNCFGLTALRMSLAYHDRRMPAETQRADYHVSSNIGRTIHAGRQSVIDARACLGWLESQGYDRLAILGTSLGSCIAFIAAMHDPRIRVAVLNHISTWFGDVVWSGLSTKHIRQSLETAVSQTELRQLWAPISPASYFDRMPRPDLRSLLIWARYDTTFLPEFSHAVLQAFRERNVPHQALALPCAHYTSGQPPFKFIDGFAMCHFAAKHL
jgi:Alpha/beta hydrolase domain containing 18